MKSIKGLALDRAKGFRFRLRNSGIAVLGFVWLSMAGEANMHDEYPDFFAMEGRMPVTFGAIESSSDELQVVVFQAERIEWSTEGQAAASWDTEKANEFGKAKIRVVDMI
jgi:hypothetical protein